MPSEKIAVLCPWYITEEPETGLAVQEIERKLGWKPHIVRGSACIDMLRSEMACEALAAGADWMLWIDRDMTFNPADIPFILRSAQSSNADIMAVNYPTKQVGGRPTVLFDIPAGESVVMGKFGSVAPALRVGFGLTFTSRRAFKLIAGNLPDVVFKRPRLIGKPFFIPFCKQLNGETAWRYLGEDYAFCERVREAGGRIVCDTHFRAGHIGRYTYRWSDMGEGKVRPEPDDITLSGIDPLDESQCVRFEI